MAKVGGLVRDDGHDLLPEEFLEMTEVGALRSKGGAVDLTQGRETTVRNAS